MNKDDVIAYKARWELVEAVEREERRSSTLELRWQQLNAAYRLALGLGLLHPDPTEMEVYERWAKIKEKMTSKPRQA